MELIYNKYKKEWYIIDIPGETIAFYEDNSGNFSKKAIIRIDINDLIKYREIEKKNLLKKS